VRPEPEPVLVRLSLLGPAYYVGLSLVLNLAPRSRGPAEAS